MADFLTTIRSLFGPRALPLAQLRGGFPVIFDRRGKIVSIVELWNFDHPSMVRELSAAGNVGEFFDWKPSGGEEIATAWSKRRFSLAEAPDTLYAAFPTALLRYVRIKEDLYFGVARPSEVAPNFRLHRADCIIYVNPDDRLMGFNETFYTLFRGKAEKPDELLNQKLSVFLNPTPAELSRKALEAAPVFQPEKMSTTLEWIPGKVSAAQVGRAVGGLRMELTKSGLRLSNPTGDHAYFVLPVSVEAGRNLAWELELYHESGWPPLFLLGEEEAGASIPGWNEYLLGAEVASHRYILKRLGIIQKMGGSVGKSIRRLTLYRTGHSFFLFENGEEKLAWHDLNFLHRGRTHFTLTLREGSACLLRRLRILSGAPGSETSGALLPLARARGGSNRAFLINPADCPGLSRARPELSAFVLADVSEMEKQVAALRRENERMRASLSTPEFAPVGTSAAMDKVKAMAGRAARLDVSVLIQGETGTGKEVLANFIHTRSPRRQGPFVKVDCSTIPESLFESELFGHEKGAFTGALAQRRGLFESAQGGTLFLDEVGNLPPAVQAKLLQFLQDLKITRLGSTRPLSLNVRLIAASNVPLSDLVAQGTFRADLFYRLDVVSITLPPLRERQEDLVALSRHFLALFNDRHGRAIKDLSPGAYEKIFAHAWPGNVRELRNAIERAAVFCEEDQIPAGLILPAGILPAKPGTTTTLKHRGRPLSGIDREALRRLFQKHEGVVLRVAGELKVTPPALYERIKKLGLTVDALRRPA